MRTIRRVSPWYCLITYLTDNARKINGHRQIGVYLQRWTKRENKMKIKPLMATFKISKETYKEFSETFSQEIKEQRDFWNGGPDKPCYKEKDFGDVVAVGIVVPLLHGKKLYKFLKERGYKSDIDEIFEPQKPSQRTGLSLKNKIQELFSMKS